MATTKDYGLGEFSRYPSLHLVEQAASVSASDRIPLVDDFRVDGLLKEMPPVKFAPRVRVLLVTAVVLFMAALGHALLGDLIGSVFAPREALTVSASAEPQAALFQQVGNAYPYPVAANAGWDSLAALRFSSAMPYPVPANAGWDMLFSPANR